VLGLFSIDAVCEFGLKSFWPENVEMHEFIVFHIKRYRIMKNGRQVLDRATMP